MDQSQTAINVSFYCSPPAGHIPLELSPAGHIPLEPVLLFLQLVLAFT